MIKSISNQDRGKYIVIEGGDGTGKSTQVTRVVSWLQSLGIPVIEVGEPGGTAMADALRVLIKDGSLDRQSLTNLLLFTAARVELWPNVDRYLSSGSWVISSRNYLSSMAYQGHAQELGFAKVLELTKNLPQSYQTPDLEVILDINDSLSKQQRLESRDIELLKKILLNLKVKPFMMQFETDIFRLPLSKIFPY